MRSLARCQADALAIRPIFTEPTTLELLGAYALAEQATRTVPDSEWNAANVAEYEAHQALRAHVKHKLALNDASLKLLLEVL